MGKEGKLVTRKVGIFKKIEEAWLWTVAIAFTLIAISAMFAWVGIIVLGIIKIARGG